MRLKKMHSKEVNQALLSRYVKNRVKDLLTLKMKRKELEATCIQLLEHQKMKWGSF